MTTRIIILLSIVVPINLNAEVWSSDFYKGMWEGCTVKYINETGGLLRHGNIKGEDVLSPKTPLLISIKKYCDCQITFLQENYKQDDVIEILTKKLDSSEYFKMGEGIEGKCGLPKFD